MTIQIFGMCIIWVIWKRNVIYLYNKKSHPDQLFPVKVSGYEVIRWILVQKTKEN